LGEDFGKASLFFSEGRLPPPPVAIVALPLTFAPVAFVFNSVLPRCGVYTAVDDVIRSTCIDNRAGIGYWNHGNGNGRTQRLGDIADDLLWIHLVLVM